MSGSVLDRLALETNAHNAMPLPERNARRIARLKARVVGLTPNDYRALANNHVDMRTKFDDAPELKGFLGRIESVDFFLADPNIPDPELGIY